MLVVEGVVAGRVEVAQLAAVVFRTQPYLVVSIAISTPRAETFLLIPPVLGSLLDTDTTLQTCSLSEVLWARFLLGGLIRRENI